MPACIHHPEVAAVSPCLDCGRAFCASCLVAHRGRALCGVCRDRALALLQQEKPGPVNTLRFVRAYSIGGMLVLFALAMISAFINSTAATVIFAVLMMLAGVTALITQVVLWIVEATTPR